MNVQAEYLAEMRRIEFLRNEARQMLDGPAATALTQEAARLTAKFWHYLSGRLNGTTELNASA